MNKSNEEKKWMIDKEYQKERDAYMLTNEGFREFLMIKENKNGI